MVRMSFVCMMVCLKDTHYTTRLPPVIGHRLYKAFVDVIPPAKCPGFEQLRYKLVGGTYSAGTIVLEEGLAPI